MLRKKVVASSPSVLIMFILSIPVKVFHVLVCSLRRSLAGELHAELNVARIISLRTDESE